MKVPCAAGSTDSQCSCINEKLTVTSTFANGCSGTTLIVTVKTRVRLVQLRLMAVVVLALTVYLGAAHQFAQAEQARLMFKPINLRHITPPTAIMSLDHSQSIFPNKKGHSIHLRPFLFSGNYTPAVATSEAALD